MRETAALDLLENLPLTRGMDAEARAELLRLCEWFAMPGGGVLFRQGEPSLDMFLLISGALGVYVEDAQGERLVGQVGQREAVGEIGLITGKGRSATVRCLRDCELLRLSQSAFEQLLRLHPRSSLALSRSALLRSSEWSKGSSGFAGSSFALLPQDDFAAAESLAERLVASLQRIGPARLLHPERDAGLTSAAYNALEKDYRFLLYLARPAADAWGALCLRQSDQLLLCAQQATPGDWPALAAHPERPGLQRQRHLISLEAGPGSRRLAGPWLDQLPGAQWHRVLCATDLDRLARLLVGQAPGLVLAGGGARGFAHIGVWRALRSLGFPIDRVAGTSIGSIIGAAIAMGWDEQELCERVRRSFVDSRPLSDYTFPFVSMVRGEKVSRLLEREFEQACIEDLRLPFRCVSTNLTAGDAVTHRRGRVWEALRASSAIPGLLPPVFEGGQVLVDGGVVDNFPLDALAELGSGPVIGVDLGTRYRLSTHWNEHALPSLWRMVLQWYTGQRRPSMAQILLRVGMINSRRATEHKREHCDLLIEPPLAGIDLLDWQFFQRAVDEGYEDTLRAVDAAGSLEDFHLARVHVSSASVE